MYLCCDHHRSHGLSTIVKLRAQFAFHLTTAMQSKRHAWRGALSGPYTTCGTWSISTVEHRHVFRPKVLFQHCRVNRRTAGTLSASHILKTLSSHPKPRFFHRATGAPREFLSCATIVLRCVAMKLASYRPIDDAGR
jgi:hypothetical protein